MIQKTYRLWVASLLTLCSASAVAQQKVEILPFGNMDQKSICHWPYRNHCGCEALCK